MLSRALVSVLETWHNPRMKNSVWLAVLPSLVTSFIGALALIVTLSIQRRRAKAFVGTYQILGPDGKSPIGGSVTIECRRWYDLWRSAPVLKVSAKYGTGQGLDKDWMATFEVLGPNMASGYLSYPDRERGALRLTLLNDLSATIEYGAPIDSESRPFIGILRREL